MFLVTGEREKPAAKDPAQLPETHPLNLVDLEKKIRESATIAVNSYREAACAVRETGLDILTLVEQSVQQTDEKGLQNIKAKYERKEVLVKQAENKAQTAIDNVTRLKEIVETKPLDAPENMKASALRNVERVMEEISTAKDDLEKEKKNASMAEKYWKKVEAARKHYIDELLILFPDVRLSDKDWRINKQDLDLFIYYCFQNVLYYQKELAKIETLQAEKLNSALRGSGEKVDKELLDATVTDALERQQRELELQFQKRILEIQQAVDKEMRIQLKRQAEAHSDHVCDALAMREKELERKFLRQEEEKLSAEQDKFKHQLAGMIGRLQGLESALKARAHIDKGAHQAQVLWSACQALHCALKHSQPGMPWQEQLRPLQNEITAVQKAALEDDELVSAVLGGIPTEAKTRGVFSETALRERFLQVESAARKVALVPSEGASLPVYFLSYLQSALLIKAVNPIPQSELLNEPTSFDKLDTYDVLQRARYWMERGNIEQTLRYMNLLSGASRSVAQDWMTEARIFLETKQAATVLMTHAAAAGLLYV
ncbi:MICOS complex subunit Mic60 [Gryllus bimaculatus]|nr:MICOS complex subunit Mic60 [Gryllus bimaculatus]